MKISGIICEYNPFHNGHKYIIKKIKNSGVTHIIAVMSGHLMQRGDISCLSKWERTKSCLENGVDIVIELPSVFSNAPANIFAKAAVHILKNINIIDVLSFGSECGDIKKLQQTYQICENMTNNEYVKEFLKKGMSYPKALSNAIECEYGEHFSNIINHPNNTLAIEYIQAINKLNANITPITIKRESVDHDSDQINGDKASASKIRKLMITKSQQIENLVPKSTFDIYTKEKSANIKNLEQVIMYKLRKSSLKDWESLPYIEPGLEKRLFKLSQQAYSYEHFLEISKTKRYTMSRIRRIVMALLIESTKSDIETMPEYIRILGVNKNSMGVLSEVTKRCRVPIFTNFKQLSYNFEKESLFEKKATDLFLIASNRKQKSDIEYRHPMIIV